MATDTYQEIQGLTRLNVSQLRDEYLDVFNSTQYQGVNLHNFWHLRTIKFGWFQATSAPTRSRPTSSWSWLSALSRSTAAPPPVASASSFPQHPLRTSRLPAPPGAQRRRIQNGSQAPRESPARRLGVPSRETAAGFLHFC